MQNIKGLFRIIFITCLFLIPFKIFGQNAIGDVYVGIQVSPNFSYRVLSNNTDDPSIEDQIDFLNNRENAALGYRLAGTLGIKAKSNWDLEVGFSFVRNCINLNVAAGESIPSRRDYANDGNADEFDIKTCYEYFGIPMRLIWNFGTERTRILASFGLTPQILLNDEIILTSYLEGNEVDKETRENTQDISGFNISPQLGLGVQFAAGERLFLRAEGIARFGILNINEDDPINAYIYSSELKVGLYYPIISQSASVASED